MLLHATGLAKSIGAKNLFHDLTFSIGQNEKVALIGRNGQGKTTLLQILSGDDHEFDGKIERKKELKTILTKQEHLSGTSQSALEYILKNVPHYVKYHQILEDFEKGKHTDTHLYSEAVEYFSENGYYYIKDLILATLEDFQVTKDHALAPLSTLSGGEKRFVELARMMYSKADLLLIDEPTNHMDYIGKEQFISWMQMTPESMLIVTHDRDVLKTVDRIIELKDKKLVQFKGNYDNYLKQNTMQTTSAVMDYQNQLNRLKEAKERVNWGLKMRATSKAWKTRYDKWLREYEAIKEATVKPSFWIDQDSTENLGGKMTESYDKFKEKNITISFHEEKHRATELVTVRNLSLGYKKPVFDSINFRVANDDRVFIKGRNGAGKSTLVKTILSMSRDETPKATIFEGEIVLGPLLRIGEYEQEINPRFLPIPLGAAIRLVYQENNIPIEDGKIKALLSQYLFDPKVDENQKIEDLSGGQKARFQIIKMLATRPNLLILDEPTNHLDLPSIEELENALLAFKGGILYISHDKSFIDKLGGDVIEI